SVGTHLGSYEILSLIGAGGMGEVYRARDTRLDRDVALKILPEAFAADANRMARFEREAKLLAALNYPNIAAIYGLEQSALVMELVEGIELMREVAFDSFASLPLHPLASFSPDASTVTIHRLLFRRLAFPVARSDPVPRCKSAPPTRSGRR